MRRDATIAAIEALSAEHYIEQAVAVDAPVAVESGSGRRGRSCPPVKGA
jgi:hypothetical protein